MRSPAGGRQSEAAHPNGGRAAARLPEVRLPEVRRIAAAAIGCCWQLQAAAGACGRSRAGGRSTTLSADAAGRITDTAGRLADAADRFTDTAGPRSKHSFPERRKRPAPRRQGAPQPEIRTAGAFAPARAGWPPVRTNRTNRGRTLNNEPAQAAEAAVGRPPGDGMRQRETGNGTAARHVRRTHAGEEARQRARGPRASAPGRRREHRRKCRPARRPEKVRIGAADPPAVGIRPGDERRMHARGSGPLRRTVSGQEQPADRSERYDAYSAHEEDAFTGGSRRTRP